MKLSLIHAFEKFGAKPHDRVRGLSAIAADGAVVLSCSQGHFWHPARGVLRYQDTLSKEAADARSAGLLAEHLTLALNGALPVRLVIKTLTDEKDGSRRSSFHVRPDLIGKVVTFDGDQFVVDFTRSGRGTATAGARH